MEYRALGSTGLASVQREDVLLENKEESWFDADGVPGPAEPVAVAEEIMDRDALHAAGKAEREQGYCK